MQLRGLQAQRTQGVQKCGQSPPNGTDCPSQQNCAAHFWRPYILLGLKPCGRKAAKTLKIKNFYKISKIPFSLHFFSPAAPKKVGLSQNGSFTWLRWRARPRTPENGSTNSRNPHHFERIEGGRNRPNTPRIAYNITEYIPNSLKQNTR